MLSSAKVETIHGDLGEGLRSRDAMDTFLGKLNKEENGLRKLAATSTAWYRYINSYELTIVSTLPVAKQEYVLIQLALRMKQLSTHYTHLLVASIPELDCAAAIPVDESALKDFIILQLNKMQNIRYSNPFICALSLSCRGALQPKDPDKDRPILREIALRDLKSNALRLTMDVIYTQNNPRFDDTNQASIGVIDIESIMEIPDWNRQRLMLETIGYQVKSNVAYCKDSHSSHFESTFKSAIVVAEVFAHAHQYWREQKSGDDSIFTRNPGHHLTSSTALLTMRECWHDLQRFPDEANSRFLVMAFLAHQLNLEHARAAFEMLTENFNQLDARMKHLVFSVLVSLTCAAPDLLKATLSFSNIEKSCTPNECGCVVKGNVKI